MTDTDKIETELTSAKTPNELINEELSKYSWKAKREFERLYPCANPMHKIEVFNKEYVKEQFYIKALKKVQGDEFVPVKEQFTPETISYETPEEFWRRWNKYKKIRSYL